MRRAWLSLLIALPLGTAAQPDVPPTPSPYPVGVRVEIGRDALGSRFIHPGSGVLMSPPNPGCTVEVGEQARAAYAEIAGRMFLAGAPQEAVLEISTVSADTTFDADGWHALVEHEIVLRSVGGQELGRWKTKGREHIPRGDTALSRAFSRAAERAAAQLAGGFEQPGVAAWLRAHGIEPRRPAFVQPADDAPPPVLRVPSGPPRGDLVVYGDLGLVFAAYHAPYRNAAPRDTFTDYAASVSARLGLSGRWVFAQVGQESVGVTGYGIDVGPLLRGRYLEIAAGMGARYGDTVAGKSQWIPSATGAIRVTIPTGDRSRARASIELRRYLGVADSFDSPGKEWIPFSVALLVGVETER